MNTRRPTSPTSPKRPKSPRSHSVPPKFKFIAPDFTMPPIDEKEVFEALSVEESESAAPDYYRRTIKHKARYKLFPNAVPPFLHSFGDSPSVIQYINEYLYQNETRQWWHKKGKLHRSGNKPAFTAHNSKNTMEAYYQNGLLHRGSLNPLDPEYDQPAQMCYPNDYHGLVIYEYFWKGNLHRLNGPAHAQYAFSVDGAVKVIESSYYLFDNQCFDVGNWKFRKFTFEVKKTQTYSTLYDVVIPNIERTLKRKRNQTNYTVPSSVIQKILDYIPIEWPDA